LINTTHAKSEKQDFIFRYNLQETDDENTKCRSRSDLARKNLENILDILIPLSGNTEVKIDGFKLLNDRNIIHKLFSHEKNNHEENTGKQLETKPKNNILQNLNPKKIDIAKPIENAAFYEPIIDYINKQLKNLLDLVDVEVEEKVVKIDAFRLKNLSQWVEDSSCDPADMLGYIATRCNCSCVFCYNKGCPTNLSLKSSKMSFNDEYREVKTRLKYFFPDKKKNLFPGIGTSYESLIHPHFKDTLKQIRTKTDQLIRISTNGTALTANMIEYISGFLPLHLDIALHSSSPLRRQKLMNDKNPEIAINALPILKKSGIVYDVVIVPWPEDSFEEMIDDMEKTIAYADENKVRLIEISLPGYSRFFSKAKLFDHDLIWKQITNKIKDIRKKYYSPIVVRPALYEENLLNDNMNLPLVIGIVKGSPAYYSSIVSGDLITKIGSNIIRNRPQARDLLSILQKSGMESINIEVLRNNRSQEFLIDLNKCSYPYAIAVDTHLGIVFMGTGLRTGYIERLHEIIDRKKAKNVLLLSSQLVKPLLQQILTKAPFWSSNDINIEIGVPLNRFFGGNICMGDLLVVQDYIDYINEYKKSDNVKPDLVVIPSSPFNLSGWGKDLTGRVYLNIERQTGIDVELLDCFTIYD